LRKWPVGIVLPIKDADVRAVIAEYLLQGCTLTNTVLNATDDGQVISGNSNATITNEAAQGSTPAISNPTYFGIDQNTHQ
jgi:hypothetical protein